MTYKIDFSNNDSDSLQILLNNLYHYKNDPITKVHHRSRINLLYSLLKKLIEEKQIKFQETAIDIGCNAGFYSKIISDFGFSNVIGIDINEAQSKIATTNFKSDLKGKCIDFKVQNAENMDLNQKFDFILCTEVIEHTSNSDKVVENIKRILAPQGIAIITLPNVISFPYIFTYLIYKIKGKHIDNDFRQHISYPFYKSLRIFRDEKLKVIKTTGVNLFWADLFILKLHRSKFFVSLNRINFRLSSWFPMKYFTQFFFIVLKNESERPA